MTQITLITQEPTEQPKPTHRCRHCVHIRSHEWNSSMKYCKLLFPNINGYAENKGQRCGMSAVRKKVAEKF